MGTKLAEYLLIFLILLAGVDNVWAIAPVQPGQVTTDVDDDDFLRTQQEHVRLRSPRRQEPVLSGLKPQTGDNLTVMPKMGASSWANLTEPFALAPLYAIMSLQC
jgi:hypothetical protein